MNPNVFIATVLAVTASIFVLGAILLSPTQQEVEARRQYELEMKSVEAEAIKELLPLMMQQQKCN